MNKSSIYPEKNAKGFKTKLSFKINFWSTVNEKGVMFWMCHSGHDTLKGKRKSQVHIHI